MIRGRDKGDRKGIFNIKYLDDHMDNEGEKSEEGYKGDVNGESDPGMERR